MGAKIEAELVGRGRKLILNILGILMSVLRFTSSEKAGREKGEKNNNLKHKQKFISEPYKSP